MLELDYTNVLDNAVGPQGIPKLAFSRAADSAKHFIETLEAARGAGKLGFADLPFDDGPVTAVKEFAAAHSFSNVLVLGIGGSALGPAALDAALSSSNSTKRLVVLDNIDPDFIRNTLDTLSPQDTIVNVIAKSVVTAETMATFAVVSQCL